MISTFILCLFQGLTILSLASTLIILCALGLNQLLAISERRVPRVPRRNPFAGSARVPRAVTDVPPVTFTTTTNPEFLDRAERKLKRIMQTTMHHAPRTPDGLVKY